MTTNKLLDAWMHKIDESEVIFNELKNAEKIGDKHAADEALQRLTDKHDEAYEAFLEYKREQGREGLKEIENEEWNPYTDACYAAQDAQDVQDKNTADREYAQMVAISGCHKVAGRPALRGVNIRMSMN